MRESTTRRMARDCRGQYKTERLTQIDSCESVTAYERETATEGYREIELHKSLRL